MLQYNSDLDLQNETKENYLIDGYNATRVNKITEVSRFNVSGAVGASIGFDKFKLRA